VVEVERVRRRALLVEDEEEHNDFWRTRRVVVVANESIFRYLLLFLFVNFSALSLSLSL